MTGAWSRTLTRWTAAWLIDQPTADRIRAYEQSEGRPATFGWSVRIALALGALMLAAGALLFVSANWDALSPQTRFALVTLLVAGFHVGGAATSVRFPKMATALHAIGTVVLGAGIFLAGQIFNLDEHWPGGVMLWAFGAAVGSILLRDLPQTTLVALLGPAWLVSEWFVATNGERWFGPSWDPIRIAALGVFLLALAYFTAVADDGREDGSGPLLHIGQALLLPAAALLAVTSGEGHAGVCTALSSGLAAIGWTVAIGLPLAVSIALRRRRAWPVAAAAAWALVLVTLRSGSGDIWVYGWWAIGAIALTAWGVRETRRERITMGVLIFGGTVLTFYFSEVMDKLGRSASLAGFGVLFLAAGWALERVRRRLLEQMNGGAA